MPFVVVYDANVLYPSTLRDLLIRVAMVGMVQAKWTDEILDETFENLKTNRPDLDAAKLDETRRRMMSAIRDCLVRDYEPLIPALDLPDPDDRHVLAAAVKCHAQVLVTWNLSDFPQDRLAGWNVEAKSPDDFLLDQIDLDRDTVWAAVNDIASAWHGEATPEDVLASLERDRLYLTVAALRS